MRHKQLPTKQRRHKSVTFIGGGQTTFSQESGDLMPDSMHELDNGLDYVDQFGNDIEQDQR